MSLLVAIFRSSREADAASGELKMRGFSGVDLQPCSHNQERMFAAANDSPLQERLFMTQQSILLGDPGQPISPPRDVMLMSGKRGAPLRPALTPEDSNAMPSDDDCTLLTMTVDHEDAIIRTILETNGAEKIRILAS